MQDANFIKKSPNKALFFERKVNNERQLLIPLRRPRNEMGDE